jgi:hypothetical protein
MEVDGMLLLNPLRQICRNRIKLDAEVDPIALPWLLARSL